MQDTSINSGASRFAETAWSRVLAAKDGGAALEDLMRAYWRPVYACLRRFHGLAIEDAKDATQEFFATLLARDFLKSVEREGGRFRGFLKASLNNFMKDRRKSENAERRGGGRATIALDAEPLEALLADPSAPAPDRIFEAEWRRSVVEAAETRLRDRLAREGKPEYLAVFEQLCVNDRETPSYREVAAGIGSTEDRVRNHLHYVRKAFREEVEAVLRDSVDSEAALEAEIRELFA